MYRNTEIIQNLDTLQQEELELRQTYTHKCELIARKRQDLLSELKSSSSDVSHHAASRNTRTTTLQRDVNEDDYDVILYVTKGIIRFRPNPSEHSPLVQSVTSKIGVHRMRLFAYMLEHPGDPFHVGNLFRAYGSKKYQPDDSTFTKAVGAFRRALGQPDTSGPYIIKQPDYEGITEKKRGYVYLVNPKWSYLVIRSKKNISGEIPLSARGSAEMGCKTGM